MLSSLSKYLNTQANASPLAVFRIGFGLMMLYGIIRFWSKGWIETLYLEPRFHFSYFGFEWVKPIGNYTYLLFFICGTASLCIALGFKYRVAIITFFLSFTYIELMDKTTYLNHYYFVSALSFLLIFLPANAYFSMDNVIKGRQFKNIPKWTIDSIKLLLGMVYFYAGLAKLNSDWLFKAMPLKIWLPSKYDLPFIGETLMHQNWFHYMMSWAGMFYDLLIPFLLLYRKTRYFAFGLVIIFHITTRVLFQIGMFPYIMIVSTLIFFGPDVHNKILNLIRKAVSIVKMRETVVKDLKFHLKYKSLILPVIALFFMIQFLFPWRYLLYPGELFWTEQGYRFSWRVMLMEKAGYANFKIVNAETGSFFYVDNSDFLSPFQEKQMSFQPDFILEYAHYLGDHFTRQGHKNVQVFADVHVALNGRMSTRYIDNSVDLYQINESFKPKNWILPFTDEIKGL